jgi:hypothetical protein
MKKITLSLFFALFFGFNLNAQSAEFKNKEKDIKNNFFFDSNGNLTYDTVMVFEKLSKEDIYIRSKNYFTYNYVSGDNVLQVDEPEKGVLVGKGLYVNVHITKIAMAHINYCFWHVIKFECKDNKARVTITLQQVQMRGDITPGSEFEKRHVVDMYPFKEKMMNVIKKHDMDSLLAMRKKLNTEFNRIHKTISGGNTDNENSDF